MPHWLASNGSFTSVTDSMTGWPGIGLAGHPEVSRMGHVHHSLYLWHHRQTERACWSRIARGLLPMFAMAIEYGCYSPDDRFLAIAPMCHGAGMIFALAPVFFGGYAEIMAGFDPEQ